MATSVFLLRDHPRQQLIADCDGRSEPYTRFHCFRVTHEIFLLILICKNKSIRDALAKNRSKEKLQYVMLG